MTGAKLGRGAILLLGAIVLFGLALRLWGIAFGLPHVYHPDEGFEIYRALRLGMGGFDLDRTGKGGLYFILFLEYGAYCAWQFVTGAITQVSDFAEGFVRDPSRFWLIARVTVAVMGAATIALVAWQARQMQGLRAAALAALFLAASAQHVEDSHFATVDVPMALFTFASVVLIVEDVAGRRRLNPWLFAGIAAFAVLNKIPAALLFVPYAVGAFFRGGWLGPRGLLRPSTMAVPVLAAVFFLIANPGFWLQWQDTMQMVQGAVVGEGGAGGEGEPGTNRWVFYARVLAASMSLGGLALAVLGIVLGVKARSRGTVLHAVFFLCYFVMLAGSASTHLYYERYVVPLLPGLALLAALGLDHAATRVAGPGTRGHWLAAAIALLVVAAPLTKSVRFSQKLSRTDTRTQTFEWVAANVPAGAHVLLEGNPEEASQLVVPLRPAAATVSRMIEELSVRDPGKAQFWEIKGRVLREPTYELLTVDHLDAWESLASFEARGAQWAVIRLDRFDGRVDPKYARDILESRRTFYLELSRSPKWERRASFPTHGERPGYDLEVWARAAS